MKEISPKDWNGKQVIIHYNDGTTDEGIQRGASELGVILEISTDRTLKDNFFWIVTASILKVELKVIQPFEENKEKEFFIKED